MDQWATSKRALGSGELVIAATSNLGSPSAWWVAGSAGERPGSTSHQTGQLSPFAPATVLACTLYDAWGSLVRFLGRGTRSSPADAGPDSLSSSPSAQAPSGCLGAAERGPPWFASCSVPLLQLISVPPEHPRTAVGTQGSVQGPAMGLLADQPGEEVRRRAVGAQWWSEPAVLPPNEARPTVRPPASQPLDCALLADRA